MILYFRRIDPNIQLAVFCTIIRKYEMKQLSESENVEAHVLLQRRLTGAASNIVQKLKNLAFVSDEPCQKSIYEDALNCREYKWKNPNYEYDT